MNKEFETGEKQESASSGIGCFFICLGIAVIIWAMKGFPVFWR